MTWWAGSERLAPLTAAVLLLCACSATAESLRTATQDMPGVIKVKVTVHSGDDGFPFQRPPKSIRVVMAADASAEQIKAVFDEYDDEIDDGRNLQGIAVILDGKKRPTLFTGEGIHATDRMVEDLVEAESDDQVIRYLEEAFPVLPSVHLTIVPLDFDEVARVVDRYREVDGIESVSVKSGEFILIRDTGNDDPRLYEARERFVHAINMRFAMTGALVSGRGPLRLAVTPGDLSAARHYARQAASSGALGRIVVDTRVRIPI